MKKPKKIRLFGYEIEIRWDKSCRHSDPGAAGRWYGDHYMIWCDGSKAGHGQRLMHEIIHHIGHYLGIDLNENKTEALSTGLTEFIRMNPDVVKFIRKSE